MHTAVGTPIRGRRLRTRVRSPATACNASCRTRRACRRTRRIAYRTASAGSTCSLTPRRRLWGPVTVSSMGCRSRGDRPRSGTTCQGSGKTSWVRPRCRRSPWTRCSSCARSARCPTTSCDPTACGGRVFGPTSRRARPPASTSRAPRRSSRASCACSRRTTTPRACCRTRWGGRGTRPTGVTATECSRRTKCSPRRLARTSTGSSGAGRAVGAPRAGSPSAPSAAWTTRAGWTPISVCATTA